MGNLINKIYYTGIISEALFGVKKNGLVDRLSVFQRGGRWDEMDIEV